MGNVLDYADRFKAGTMPRHILDDAVPDKLEGDRTGGGGTDVAQSFQRGDEAELGAHLAAELGPKGDVVCAENRVWLFNGASWAMLDDEDLTRRALTYAGQRVRIAKPGAPDTFRRIRLSSTAAKGVVQICKVHLHDPTFFAEAPAGAAFANCFARIDGKSVAVEPLTRAHRVKREHAAPFNLPTNAGRPESVDRLLAQAWAGCDDLDERVRYFWEWLGAAICGIATRYKDTPLLVGPKDTGKSQILHAISVCFPADSRKSVPLQAMSNEYQRAHLSDGRINRVNELPARELLDGEAPKAILSGDPVVCRRPCEKPFEWTPRCAHVFAANELPPSRDAALLDRFVLLACANAVPREQQDRALPDKIAAEAPQIVAAAVSALTDLLLRGHLVRPQSAHAAASDWKLNGDAVATWALECLEVSDKSTPAMELYEHFDEWRERNGHTRMNTTNFGRRLGALGLGHLHSNGKRWRVLIRPHARRAGSAAWSGGQRASE